MQQTSASLRNKLMVACALVAAAVLATPAAMAHEHHGHGDRAGAMIGALVVGAVIGGVVASASHDDDYYRGGYYYPAQPYPSDYYGYNSYPSYPYNSYPSYSYNSYPSYYGGGYYYPPTYGSRVNIGVVYSNRGGRYRGHDYRGHYDHDYRGHYDRSYEHRWNGDRGDRGGGGHYYRGH